MNDFDLLIEKYSRELIDAKRKSILSEIEDLPQTEDVKEKISEIFEDNSNDDEEEFAEEEVYTAVPDFNETNEDVNPIISETEQLSETETVSDNLPPFINSGETEAAISADLSNAENAPNTGFGTLKIQVYAADQAYPISVANVEVTKSKDDNVLFQGYTDLSGVVDDIRLPAPSRELSETPTETKPYSQYDLNVSHPKFISRKYTNIPIFEGMKSVQTVQLVPNDAGSNEQTVTDIKPNNFLLERQGKANG